MGKLNERKDLWLRTSRSLLAVSIAASLAAFGCTTNHNLGNGTPTRSGPDVRSAPTSGVTTGGETYTLPPPPPMTSSYSGPDSRPTSSTRTIRRSPDEAAAIMAGHQASRGVYLGVTNPGPNGGVVDPQTNRVVNPSMLVNPQLTVNSSLSSSPTSAINTGAGDAAGAAPAGGTAAVTIAGTATGTLPIVASSRVPSVTAASASAPIRITRGTTGSVTVTNVRNK